MKKWKILFWLCGILLFSTNSILAQAWKSIPTPNYPFIRFTVDDGLPQSIVSALMQDSYGYVWIGTNEGIARFDGHNFKVYSRSTGYPFRLVTGAVEKRPGEIWVASLGPGLWRLVKDKVEKINFDSTLKHYELNFLTKTSDEEILLGSEPGGLYVFRNDSIVLHLSDLDSTLKGAIISAAKDEQGNYWVGTFRNGLQVFHGNQEIKYLTVKDGLPSNEIRSILPMPNGEVWIGTSKGLYVVGNADFTKKWEEYFHDAFVSDIYSNDQENIWIALSSKAGGVVHVRNGHIVEIIQPNAGFFSKCVLLGNSGSLFVGSYHGLFVYPNRNFENFGSESGLTDTYIRAIGEDCDGNLLVGSKNDGLFILRKKHFEKIAGYDSLFGGISIFAIKHFRNQVWIGTARGLYIFKDFKLIKNELTRFFKGVTVRRIKKINNAIYFVTRKNIYRFTSDDSLTEIKYNLKNDKFSVWGINSDKNGLITIATNGKGIWQLIDTTWVPLPTPDTLQQVFAVRNDKEGNLYFATAKGAYKWDGEHFTTILKLNQTVWDLLPTEENGIWLLTSKGLYQVTDDDVMVYNKSLGIITTEFNMGAVFRRKKNDYWFGGVDGLVHYQQKLLYPRGKPLLYISSIISRDTTLIYPFNDKIVFRANDNSLKIVFHQINYGNFPTCSFAYWLEGLNRDTVLVKKTDVNFADFTNLQNGVYTFHVYLINPITHSIVRETSVTFTILAPWWKSVWFALLIIVIVTLLLLKIIRWRVSIVERRNLLLEQQVQERTHDIQISYKLLKKETEERKKAEISLLKEREQLAITLKSIADGVVRTDLSGNIHLMNTAAEEIFGISSERAKGKNINDLIELQDEESGERVTLPDYIQKIEKNESHLNHFDGILKPKNSKNEKILNISWSRIVDDRPDESGYVLVFRDISLERRLESEMMRSQKLESIGLLAGGIAHDFNNILSGILGNAQLAQLAYSAKKDITKYLKGIIEATQNATRLTQQLLTFAKGGEPVKEIIDLKDLLRESVEFTLRGTNVICSYHIADDLWAVKADKGQINQVINNLVINAVHAMPNGGQLTVSAQNVDRHALQEGVSELDGEAFVKISVSDTGHGIPKENLEKIFDPYFTTKQKGSGLGLATTYAIIKKHDGKIVVESELGRGTTFHIYLPALPDYKIQRQEENISLVSCKGKRILVMDDEPYIRDLMGSFLEMLEAETDFAQDGEEAIEKYEKAMKAGQPFDVVIMDLTIRGGMGGKEAVKKIMQIDPEAKVIVASGYSMDSVLASAEEFGFKGRLSKPFSLEELNEVLTQVLSS